MQAASPDLTFFIWIAILLIALVCLIGPLVATGRIAKPMKKLESFMQLFSTPPQCNEIISSTKYNIPQSMVAAQIIQSWFPHDETEMIEGAPAQICGRVRRTMNNITGVGSVDLEVFYKIMVPQTNFPLVTRTGTLTIHLAEKLRQTEISYEWNGPEAAIKELFSTDHLVLTYLIDRCKREFEIRSYKEISKEDEQLASQPRSKKLGARQAKQWWRVYDGGAQGERVYSHWPNPQDYAEAVQNPQQNFMDTSLQNSAVTVNQLGIPQVTSGMFASVYQFKSDEEQWAVRCFDTRLIDQQERYKAISSFILSDDLTYTVDFHFLEDGIKSGGTWFPILKMTWVEGQALDSYVRDNHANYNALRDLRWEFQTMMEKLRLNGVAHGDLQHGNIIVNNGEIFLVDYDGFYVPELAGRHSNELGHANYQHPTRTEKYFGPYLDNFAAYIIDLSLLCLMEDPSLWEKFAGGDECLIFRKPDYTHPETSKLIALLSKHESGRLRSGIQKLLSYLQTPLEQLPFLESDMPLTMRVEDLHAQAEQI